MPRKTYEAAGIHVHFDARRCIHAARCVEGLPAVFDADRRPWIAPEAAPVEAVAEVVRQCPSGALTYERLDGGPAEPIDEKASVATVRDGPLYLRGRCLLTDHEGRSMEAGPRAALCRCGASRNKPFCDKSHVAQGFRDRS
jgi:uncharacterized Fe-S cluster protein YjdI